MKSLTRWGFVLTALVAVPLALAGTASGQGGLVLTDLGAPRGLSSTGSHVLIADQGGGRILNVSRFGTIGVIVDGLPTSTIDEGDGETVVVGVTAVIDGGGIYYFTVGESEEPGFDSVYSVRPGGKPSLVADLGDYEEANNTDGDVDGAGEPELLSNPFDLVRDGAGGLYISASGANAVLHIDASGDISPFAIFPNRANPLFPAVGGPTMDQVPTGLEVGPDGALYVTTLTGFPFPPEAARVYRLEDSSGDGDALDDGETTIYAEGLTAATNLAFDLDGSLLVTEFSLNLLAEAHGRLVRVVDGAIAEVVAEPLITPTGVTVMGDGTILVSQEFLGIVAEVSEAVAIASSPPPGAITPPATGDAGLAASDPTAPYVIAALLSLGLAAGVAAAGRLALGRSRRA